jgi:hypothetical protein
MTRPADFRLPRSVEGGWELGGHAFAENPRFTCPAWALALAATWAQLRAARGGGMAGPGAAVFPRAGGYCDQPALAMEAFALFDRWLEEGRADAHSDRD